MCCLTNYAAHLDTHDIIKLSNCFLTFLKVQVYKYTTVYFLKYVQLFLHLPSARELIETTSTRVILWQNELHGKSINVYSECKIMVSYFRSLQQCLLLYHLL